MLTWGAHGVRWLLWGGIESSKHTLCAPWYSLKTDSWQLMLPYADVGRARSALATLEMLDAVGYEFKRDIF